MDLAMEMPLKMEHPMSDTPMGTHSTPEPSSLTPAGSVGTKTVSYTHLTLPTN